MNKMTRADAKAIAERCEDAYSFDAYAPGAWRQCAWRLALRGFDESQIEEILRSKWTRWAGDASDKQYGRYNSADLMRFIDAGEWTPEKVRAEMESGRR